MQSLLNAFFLPSIPYSLYILQLQPDEAIKPDVVAHTCNSGKGRWRHANPKGSPVNQPNLIAKLQISVRNPTGTQG